MNERLTYVSYVKLLTYLFRITLNVLLIDKFFGNGINKRRMLESVRVGAARCRGAAGSGMTQSKLDPSSRHRYEHKTAGLG